jgi:uncharacterized membrane protein SirB2
MLAKHEISVVGAVTLLLCSPLWITYVETWQVELRTNPWLDNIVFIACLTVTCGTWLLTRGAMRVAMSYLRRRQTKQEE